MFLHNFVVAIFSQFAAGQHEMFDQQVFFFFLRSSNDNRSPGILRVLGDLEPREPPASGER